jgi:hypothetical protein
VDAALAEERREDAVRDRRADLDLMSSPMIGRPFSSNRFCQ